MRVCLISGEYPPMQGGVGDYTRELGRALQHQGHATCVLTSTAAQPPPEPSLPHDPEVRPVVTRWNWQCWSIVLSTMRQSTPDVVHIQYQTAAYGMHPAINLLPSLIRRIQPGPRLLVTLHDLRVPYLFPKAGPLRQAVNRLLMRHCDGVIVTNEEDQEDILDSRLTTPLRLIPIGSNIPTQAPPNYDRSAHRSAMGISEDETVLCYFGFLNASKGGEALLRVTAELIHRGHKIKLLMIGGQIGSSDPTNAVSLRRVQELAQGLNLEQRMIWTGFTAPEQVSANFWASDLCILPYLDGASYRRGSFMAALAHGLPIISTQPRVRLETLLDDQNVLLAPPDDVRAISAAAERLITDPELRRRLGRGASALAKQFSWDHIADQTAQFYQELGALRT